MQIEFAELVEGSETEVLDGASRPTKCLLRKSDGSIVSAVLKRLETRRVLTEAFCSLTLRRWGLHVPQPFLVRSAGKPISFASADEGFPNLRQRLDFDDELPQETREALRIQAAHLISGFSQTPLAIAADEAIFNFDRHLGNILWDGSTASWIDHDRCLARIFHESCAVCFRGRFRAGDGVAGMIFCSLQLGQVRMSALAV